MKINAYLSFNGNCEEAIAFYAETFGGKIAFKITNEESPMAMETPEGWQKKIMHARMSVNGQVLMASDAPPGHFHKPQGFSVSLTVGDPAEAEQKFKALCEGGSVNMPFGKTFFSKGFGMGIDQFGIPWMVNCPLENL